MSTAFIRRGFILLLGLAFALVVDAVFAADSVPTVRIDTGTLSGSRDAKSGLDEFKGIPYAAPPVGSLRWKPPQPVSGWTGVRKADHFGPRCMQRPLYGDMVFRSAGMKPVRQTPFRMLGAAGDAGGGGSISLGSTAGA